MLTKFIYKCKHLFTFVIMNNRLKEFFKSTGMSQQDLSEKLDVSKATISHLAGGRNKPSVELIQSLKTNFPDLSLDWLIMNEGEMTSGNKEGAVPDIRQELDKVQHVAEQTHREIKFQINVIKEKLSKG